ncbi:sodium- and chloride-dependent glycine transporter 1-like [Gigantopelta aegis]|uniref:sodium- and chloride-dependent glycine transporter 1-like n=1 Tax=Gigantopelta aegis TaxID=1735272 RepID=UPI001B887ADD|nr:sodium- and chloride-dependent glycine transporter 1-like [Gigantopelta aegis]
MSGYNVGQVEALLSPAKDRSGLVKSRDRWGRQAEFILTLIGFAVGLGNVWRFPYLAYENGGGAFLIPYILSLVFMGIPLFCLEVTFGQFASMGPLSIWAINPLFKGLGYTMVILSGVISIYYNVVVAQCIYFFFASLTSTLPWISCDNPWNTCHCISSIANATSEAVLKQTGLNCTGVNISVSTARTSTEEYYYRRVLDKSSGLDVPGNIKWDLTACNLLIWIVIAAALCRGVKTMGKVAYFFSIIPYILLTIMLIRGVTLEGHELGIAYYLNPDLSKLKDSKVWLAAASQIFFSLSACTGSLTAMSSYNKFTNNTIRDSIIIPIINCLTSFYAGFAIFSTLGFMAHQKKVSMENVTEQDAFILYIRFFLIVLVIVIDAFILYIRFFLIVLVIVIDAFILYIRLFLIVLDDNARAHRARIVNAHFQ